MKIVESRRHCRDSAHPSSEVIKCPDCSRAVSRKNMKRHTIACRGSPDSTDIAVLPEREHKCPEEGCSFAAHQIAGLQAHANSVHARGDDKSVWICRKGNKGCDRKFATQSGCSNHRRKCHAHSNRIDQSAAAMQDASQLASSSNAGGISQTLPPINGLPLLGLPLDTHYQTSLWPESSVSPASVGSPTLWTPVNQLQMELPPLVQSFFPEADFSFQQPYGGQWQQPYEQQQSFLEQPDLDFLHLMSNGAFDKPQTAPTMMFGH